MNTPKSSNKTEVQPKPGGFGLRTLAFILDQLLCLYCLVFIHTVIFRFLGASTGTQALTPKMIERSMNLYWSVALTIFLILAGFLDSSSYRGTPGKWICGLQVGDQNQNRLSPIRAILRQFLRLTLGVLSFPRILFRHDKPAIHDLIIGSSVVCNAKKPVFRGAVAVTLFVFGCVVLTFSMALIDALTLPGGCVYSCEKDVPEKVEIAEVSGQPYKGPIVPTETGPTLSASRQIVFLIDKSRSAAFGGIIEDERTIVGNSIRGFAKDDVVSIIAFDTEPFIVLKTTAVAEALSDLNDRLEKIVATGKTDLSPAIIEACRMLQTVKANKKYLIFLSDGKIPLIGDYLFRDLHCIKDSGATITSIALGSEPDGSFMEIMSQFGNGQYHRSKDPAKAVEMLVQMIN